MDEGTVASRCKLGMLIACCFAICLGRYSQVFESTLQPVATCRKPLGFPVIFPVSRELGAPSAWEPRGRCLWGTDWARAYTVVDYEQVVEPFLKTDRLSDSDRAMLMAGACAKAYCWSPKKS